MLASRAPGSDLAALPNEGPQRPLHQAPAPRALQLRLIARLQNQPPAQLTQPAQLPQSGPIGPALGVRPRIRLPRPPIHPQQDLARRMPALPAPRSAGMARLR